VDQVEEALNLLINLATEVVEIFLVDQVKEAVDILVDQMEEIMEMFQVEAGAMFRVDTVESLVDQEQVEVEVVEDMVAAAAEVEVVTMAAMLLKLIIIIKLNFYNDISS
jgi:hypothetical protein